MRIFAQLFTIFAVLLTSPLASAYDFKPMDKMLTDYDYPYPVKNYTFNGQQQELTMAYMDISPENTTPNTQTVVLLHGKNFTSAYWQKTIKELVSEGFRVIVPDQIGFGKSSKPAHLQYTFQSLATWTTNLVKNAGVEQFHLVGHSMGGMVATRLALMFPEHIQSLSLVNPIGLEDWKTVVPYQTVNDWYAQSLNQTPESIQAYQEKAYFDGDWDNDYYDNMVPLAGWALGPDKERMAWLSALTYDMIFTQPVMYEFYQLNMPTHLIIGTRDRTALGRNLVADEAVRESLGRYDKLGEKVASMIPNATLTTFEDIGHMPQVEIFGEYIDALTTFIKSH